MLKLLSDTRQDHLWVVAEGLLDIAPEHGAAIVPAMVASIRNPKALNPHMAAGALAKLGPQGKEAIPTLVQALKDPNPSVRQSCGYAILRIEPGNETVRRQALAALIESLQPKRELHSRRYAVRCLGELGELARP